MAAGGPSGHSASAPLVSSAPASALPFRQDKPMAMEGFAMSAGAVLLVGATVFWLLKRHLARRFGGATASAQRLRVGETVWITPKVRVSTIKCGERELVLAHSDSALAWIEPPSAPSLAPASATTP